jgi:hypothetical protein
MAEFLYYLPGARGEALDERRRLGLDETLGRDNVNAGELSPGPDGGPGVLLSRGYPDYQPQNQAWTPVAGVWLGVWAADPPRPEDLLRPEMVLRPGGPVGRPLRLLDGNEWLVPVVYPTTSEEYALPRVLRLGPSDPPVRFEEVPEQWRPLVAGADLIIQALRAAFEKNSPPRHQDTKSEISSGSEPEQKNLVPSCLGGENSLRLELPDTLDLGALALSVNYRVGAREAAMLGLFDTRSLAALAGVLIDQPALFAAAENPESKIQNPKSPEAP